MSEFVSVERINSLKQGIEAKTGETYSDLTGGVQALMDGYGQGGDTDYLAMRLTDTLTEYSNPDITSIPAYAFNGCKSLVSLDMPNLVDIGDQGLQGAQIPFIGESNFPKLTTFGARCLRDNYALTEISKPNTDVTFDGLAVEGCKSLRKVDVLSVNWRYKQQNLFFANCPSLEAFIIRRTDIVNPLGWTNIFGGSGVESGIGYIYVPAALVDGYKTATNWSNYAEQIRAIEDYPEITGG